MKKVLLPNLNSYKANMHCHTVMSDGEHTEEEIKKLYKERGYSIVAYTDHDIIVSRNHLTDENFLALNGLELEINSPKYPSAGEKTCHFCAIALDKNNVTQPCYHREKFLIGNPNLLRNLIKYDESLPNYERIYTPEKVSEMMQICRDNGYFVTYNHPVWSLETYNDYINYNGMHAMEIYNYSSICTGYPDYNEDKYDEMLRAGKKIYGVGGDDNHNHRIGRKNDSFGAFTVIKAQKLDYESVATALKNGTFYTSQGPEINEIWYDDGRLYVTSSNCDNIRLNTGVRRADVVFDEGSGLNKASFTVNANDKYIRITVTDANGNKAHSNAYFLEDFI